MQKASPFHLVQTAPDSGNLFGSESLVKTFDPDGAPSAYPLSTLLSKPSLRPPLALQRRIEEFPEGTFASSMVSPSRNFNFLFHSVLLPDTRNYAGLSSKDRSSNSPQLMINTRRKSRIHSHFTVRSNSLAKAA